MIVKKELSVSGRKKAEIVSELRKRDFKPFPKVLKAKAAGEDEEVVDADPEEEEQATGASSDFDYLLGMAIWSLTHEKVTIASFARQAKSKLHFSFLDSEITRTSEAEREGVACIARADPQSNLEY